MERNKCIGCQFHFEDKVVCHHPITYYFFGNLCDMVRNLGSCNVIIDISRGPLNIYSFYLCDPLI